MTPVFLLGCERSGSTWVANLLDAHPAVELLMEPFAGHAGLFPGVPLRMEPASPDPTRIAAVREGLARAAGHKYPLLYRRGRRPALEAVDRALAGGVGRAARRVRMPVPRWIARYELLSLNAAEVGSALRARKTRAPSVRVVKELRLNRAVPLIAQAFPDARFIAIVRHPVTEVASMERWIARGHLRELARCLAALPEAFAAPGPLRAYAALLEGRGGERVERLAAYWVASYGTLLADLRRGAAPYRVLRHEDLCRTPESETQALLRFCGLDVSPETDRYLHASSRGGAREPLPLDTRRETRSLPARALEEAPAGVRERVLAALDVAAKEGVLDPDLAGYLDGRG